ncbi:MAG: hypothetical protein AAF628_17820 [Planctomycetota bacterium]
MMHPLVAIAILAITALPAQVTSPPGLQTVEGVAHRSDVFATPTFRLQHIDLAAPEGVYTQVALRHDGLPFAEKSAAARSFRLLIVMGEFDYSSLPAPGTARFIVPTRTSTVLMRTTVSLPNLQSLPASVPGPAFSLMATAAHPYVRSSPTGALVLDIVADQGTASGAYPLDAEASLVAGRDGPDGCEVLGTGQPFRLQSTMTVDGTGYGWGLCGDGAAGSAMGMLVGRGGGGAPPIGPDPPCHPIYATGQVGFALLGVADARGQVKFSTRLPPIDAWARGTLFMQAVQPDPTQPYSLSLSNGVAQTFPMRASTIPKTTTIFAADALATDGEVQQGGGLVFELTMM